MTKKRQTLTLLSLAIGAYLLLAAWNIELPGPYGDEFFQAPDAVCMLTGSSQRSGLGVTIGGRFIPLMSNEYVGSVRSYALLPAFYLLGFRVLSHRLTTILITTLGLVIVALFARKAMSDGATVVATWLIATDPSLILSTRTDLGPAAISFTLRVAAYYLVWRWWSSRGKDVRSLLGAAVVLGLGMYDKTNFLWVVLSIVAVVVIARLWQFFDSGERVVLSLKHLGLAGVLIFIASTPLWLFNLTHDWITFRLATLPGEPVTLKLLLERIPSRNGSLLEMFNSGLLGTWMSGEQMPAFIGPMRSLLLPLTVLAVVGLVLVAIRDKRRELLVLPALGILLLAQMYLTPRPIAIHHLIVLYPIPHLAIGLAASLLFREPTTKWKTGIRALTIGLVLIAIGMNVATMVKFHRAISRTGGSALWTETIHTLTDKLRKDYSERTIQVLDWGIWPQLVVLTGGRLDLREPIYELEKSADAPRRIADLASDRRNVFVLHAPEVMVFKWVGVKLDDAVQQYGLRIRNESQIRDRAGRVVFRIFEFE